MNTSKCILVAGSVLLWTCLGHNKQEINTTNIKKEVIEVLHTETWVASFYGDWTDRFAGKRMKNWERMNPNALTAAHKTRPMGTVVRVIENDPKTHQSDTVVVEITDRMPFTESNKECSLDVTPKVFKIISDLKKWRVEVILEVLKRWKKKKKKSKKRK